MKNEKGSIVVWLLVGVLLFAALGMAMMRGSRTSSVSLSNEEARTYAKMIVSQAEEVKSAIKRLQFRGCADTQINLAHDGINVNPTAPPGNKCDVFHPAGGGLTYKLIPLKAIDTVDVNGNGAFLFQSGFQIEGNGTDATDLHLQLNRVLKPICLAINDLLGVENPGGGMPIDGNDSGNITFVGVYGPTRTNTIGDDPGSNLAGKPAFCRNGPFPTSGQFNYVLIAR